MEGTIGILSEECWEEAYIDYEEGIEQGLACHFCSGGGECHEDVRVRTLMMYRCVPGSIQASRPREHRQRHLWALQNPTFAIWHVSSLLGGY